MMQVRRFIPAIVLVALVGAACGGSPGATAGPVGATTNPGGGGGGGATEAPGATVDPGGGGGGGKPAGWDQYGKASYEISAPISRSGELGFVPAASRFDGEQGTSLAFTLDGTQEVLTVLLVEGKVTVSYGSESATVGGIECTTSNLSVQAASAKGSFDCPQTVAFLASGASVANATIKGSFDVHG